MKKSFFKLLALVAAITAVLSFAACGNGTEAEPESATDESVTLEAAAAEPETASTEAVTENETLTEAPVSSDGRQYGSGSSGNAVNTGNPDDSGWPENPNSGLS